MTNLPAEAKIAGSRGQSARRIDSPAQPRGNVILFALVAGVAFGLYWASSFVLEARNATTHFGADS